MVKLNRRAALGALAAGTAGAGCNRKQANSHSKESLDDALGSASEGKETVTLKNVFDLPLGRPWPTPDPFLFCVHHNDRYPRGNGKFGPAASLEGRDIGRDFDWKDGWNMYHGRDVPGFPAHPHRGFETVTVVRKGRLDHADSLGAAARYGDGDVQWLTAGSGIQHAEMFPLLKEDEENPLDLFQIWLNLPRKNKLVSPYFSMLWADTIPTKVFIDGKGKKTTVTVRAGLLGDVSAPAPPPDSWASDPNNEVGIWTIEMEEGSTFTLPAASPGVSRNLYLVSGGDLSVGSQNLRAQKGAELFSSRATTLAAKEPTELLVLQGRPIGEPIAKNGPFVMNTQAEIRKAYADYRQTRFGGWPWDNQAPVHGSDPARFARLVDGKSQRPG